MNPPLGQKGVAESLGESVLTPGPVDEIRAQRDPLSCSRNAASLITVSPFHTCQRSYQCHSLTRVALSRTSGVYGVTSLADFIFGRWGGNLSPSQERILGLQVTRDPRCLNLCT